MLSAPPGICYCAGMPQAMTPTYGARFELNRRQVDAQRAIYDVVIFLPQGSQSYTLNIAATDGQCQLAPADTGPIDSALPDWVHKHLLALARGVYRAAKQKGPDGLAGELAWQRRIMRWHEEPHETESRGKRVSGAASPASADG